MNKFYKISLSLLLIIFSVLPNVFAQSTVGKLAGMVVDADTKEPLIGANVLILGTALGAATDINGEYFILNIVPGEYTVRVSYVGYGEKVIQGVRIVGGVTYELNVELKSGIELREVVITSKKLFEEKATNTIKVIDSDDIDRLPVKGIEQLASLQAGVVIAEGSGGAGGNATINVRGGRGNEVLYVIDGVVQNDPLFGQNFTQVSNAAIDQIAFQVGGYEAKYGQAQSGIVNVTTKSGGTDYSVYGEALTSTFTDDYGYNLYTFNLSGPIFPGVKGNTIFLSAERGWFLDGNPSAIGISFKSIGKESPVLPGNSEGLWRFTARTYHDLGNEFALRLGAIYNERDFRSYIHSYAKNNPEHNPRIERQNLSLSMKFSKNFGSSSFLDATLGYKGYFQEEGDGVFFNNLEAYGDTLTNPFMPRQGNDAALSQDDVGIFPAKGRVNNFYRKIDNKTFTGQLSFTSQQENHLFEIGGGFEYYLMRYYRIFPNELAINNRTYIDPNGDTVAAKTQLERFQRQRPLRYGYDVMGNEIGTSDSLGAETPVLAYGYVQDRFELEDLVINVGLRLDYFATNARIFKNRELPYAGGTNPNDFDDGDYITKDPETYLSPRIGLGFPVTSSTVFHAQYGRFIQSPRLIDAFLFESRAWLLQNTDNFQFNDGYINSEVTTQYEVGFRQILGDNAAALNVTAFYKNTEGLTNTQARFFFREPGGQRLIIFGASNTDFGTIKGLALSVDVPRISYFSLSVNYTLSLAEGTGSSQSSSFVAAFRNINGEIPRVIAPLDFDQRHTGIINLNFYVPEGDLGIFELTSLNLLFTFNSGRPYTPLQEQNLLEGSTNWGETSGYVNSRYGPGSFRIDLKLEKSFRLGSALITPYLWIENLLDADNVVNVWRSTGSPYTTDFLSTEKGQNLIASNGEAWKQDYMSLERNPANFGIPRLIKLGLKVNFSKL